MLTIQQEGIIFPWLLTKRVRPMLLLLTLAIFAQQTIELAVYNVENLFDLDGKALYSDYLPVAKNGEPQYTPEHVLNKTRNVARIFTSYGNGKGPDIMALVELESDQTQPESWLTVSAFKSAYGDKSLEQLILEGDPSTADLPSHLLLYKALMDVGLDDYDVAILPSPDDDGDGTPDAVHMNAVFSRLPIVHDSTRIHPVERARPILEVWLKTGDTHGVIFVNHWKSGASSSRDEQTRLQNAHVLRSRLDEIRNFAPHLDLIVVGDLNSNYNQKQRLNVDKTGINDVLMAVGDERLVANKAQDYLYNLWYELPVERRGSEMYSGKWSTLMHIIINDDLYDKSGFQYVDASFSVGRFDGMNTQVHSPAPMRWSGAKQGFGFSDHFPLSARFLVHEQGNTEAVASLSQIGKPNAAAEHDPIPVAFFLPDESSMNMGVQLFDQNTDRSEWVDSFFKVEGKLTPDFGIMIEGERFGLHSYSFDYKKHFAQAFAEEKPVTLHGIFGQFRGNWQFIIDSPDFVVVK